VKWLSLHIGGQKWGVHVVSPRSKHLKQEGCELDGKCDYQACRIYLSQAMESPLREDTLVHELLHALLFVTGAEKVYDSDASKDESLVQCLTPALHRLLKDLGFRFPKGPNDG
jgi:Zn-dependent peptidase ImmA (M78 family)